MRIHTHAHTLLYHTCIAHIKHYICNRVNILRQLHTLPQLHIMKYLDVHSLVAMTMTCHELYILGQDSFLWRELFTRDFGQGKYVPPYSYSSPHSQSVFLFPIHILIRSPYSHSQSVFSFAVRILIPNPYSHSQSIFSFAVHILIPNPYSHSQSIFSFAVRILIPSPYSYSQSVFSFAVRILIPSPYSHFQSIFSFPICILIPNPYSHSQSICRVTAHIHNLEAGRSVMMKRTQILFESLSET